MSAIIPVILCGGAGARLWPLSHRDRSKVFFEMADGRTLLRHAMDRARLCASSEQVIAITNQSSAEQIITEWQAIETQTPPLNLLIEPCQCSTGAALASTALMVERQYGEQAVVLALPADHLIADEAELVAQVGEAKQVAEQGHIVIFGITPHAGLTNYGYIEHDLSEVLAFHEKPDASTAKSYLASGRHLWNAGIVVATAGTLIRAFEHYAPQILTHCRKALEGAHNSAQGMLLDRRAYARCPYISFDHAVLEKADNVRVLNAKFDWCDLGNWGQVGQLMPADSDGNHVSGNATLFDANNCIVQAGKRPVGIVGLDNIVVVDSPEGLLVVHADAVEQVKSLFGDLNFAQPLTEVPAMSGLSESSADAFLEKP